MTDYEKLAKTFSSYPTAAGARCCIHTKGKGTIQNPGLADRPDPFTSTVHRCFLNGLAISRDENCLGRRVDQGYEFMTFQQVNEKVDQLAQALTIKSNIKPKDSVGIYSANCPEWCVVAFASASASFILVPLYDTLGAQACTDIIEEVEMKIMFVDTYAAAQRILHQVDARLPPSLKTVVVFNNPGKEMNAGHNQAISIVTLDDYLKLPEGTKPAAIQAPTPDDLYMVQYTSGTTGRPKGVMLTHGNFAANIAGVMDLYRRPDGSCAVYTPNIVILHYLPLAHSYGQLVMITGLYVGGTVGFFGGNIQKILDDAVLLQPTFLPLVPRLMNKFYAKVYAEIERKGGLAKKLFNLAYAQKRDLLVRKNICTRKTLWDKLIFKNLQAKLGGRVEFMLTTSAPVSAEVLEFWRVVFGTTMFEGYGQTEATALVTCSFDPEGGNVGHPVSCNSVKLADVEELGYFAREGKGEICIKGPNVMKGYYKQPEKTAEALDADGWLHTGDIGQFLPNGALKLIDRKKHIFKLAQGEYIAPEKIEAVYASCPLVGQVFVDGNGLQWFTVGVIVPDAVEAQQWAEAKGLQGHATELPALCKNDDFKQHVLKSLQDLGKAKGLNQLEQVRAIHLHHDAFSVANDLLTPSMKNRRPQLRAFFKEQIDSLYANSPAN